MHKKDDYSEEELEENPLKKKLTKIIVLITGLFLILLILSFSFLRYPVGNILHGQIQSHEIKDNVLNLDDLTIIFENKTHLVLSEIYETEQATNLVETSVCLKGKKLDNTYIINSIYYPEIFDQSFMHVSFANCPDETLIMLHTHPYKSCLASDQDLEVLAKAKQRNPDVLMIIMCEPNRYSVYD